MDCRENYGEEVVDLSQSWAAPEDTYITTVEAYPNKTKKKGAKK